ncbi:MAG: Hsp20/alpha crystallin family protein [Acidocella sp.]|nr:Hsp20/alpha crystallin family protein [Acidocella sp.]
MANIEVDLKKTTPAPQPHDRWRSFRNELDRVFEQFGQSISPWLGRENVKLPSVDITEDDKAFTVTAELPGLTAEDVDVSLEGRTLVIKGEKQQETKTEEKNYHLTERTYGAFQRSFYMPDGVDADAINAAVAKGVLTVTLPKLPAAAVDKAKKIEVKTA